MATEGPVAPGLMGKPLIEKIKLLLLFGLIGVFVYFSHPTPKTFAIGTLLVSIGTLIRIWAGGHLTRDQQLTTSGPYQFSRNPFYLGRLFLLVGFAIMSGLGADLSEPRNIILWVVFVVALIIFFFYYMPRKEQREGG